jgi:GNAT superfamily N-acetyltransferase
MKTTSSTKITRTYLEMHSRSELKAARSGDPGVRLREISDCPPFLYRTLYVEVGRNYHWIDRLPWTDEQISEHLQQSEIRLWLMTHEDAMAGYFELRQCVDGSVEIAYFGLLPEFLGRGLGKHLLTCATEQAWATGANRVWLHTCTLDDRAAMPNYVRRGFRSFKTEDYVVDLPAQLEVADQAAARMVNEKQLG